MSAGKSTKAKSSFESWFKAQFKKLPLPEDDFHALVIKHGDAHSAYCAIHGQIEEEMVLRDMYKSALYAWNIADSKKGKTKW